MLNYQLFRNPTEVFSNVDAIAQRPSFTRFTYGSHVRGTFTLLCSIHRESSPLTETQKI